jgi:hypothetical protein
VFDVVMRQLRRPIADFGNSITAGLPFGLLMSEAFDPAMDPRNSQGYANLSADPLLVAALQ